jgi:hypothetical protein
MQPTFHQANTWNLVFLSIGTLVLPLLTMGALIPGAFPA